VHFHADEERSGFERDQFRMEYPVFGSQQRMQTVDYREHMQQKSSALDRIGWTNSTIKADRSTVRYSTGGRSNRHLLLEAPHG